MTTIRKNHGPFIKVARSIRTNLKHGDATLTCHIQRGTTPMGRPYSLSPKWFIRYDGSPCGMGPYSADHVRKFFSV